MKYTGRNIQYRIYTKIYSIDKIDDTKLNTDISIDRQRRRKKERDRERERVLHKRGKS